MLVVPKIRTKAVDAAATLWNDLHSTDLKRVEMVSAFKSGLKTYFSKLLQEVAFSTFFYILCVLTHNVADISI